MIPSVLRTRLCRMSTPLVAGALVLAASALGAPGVEAQQSQVGDPIPQEGQQNPAFSPDTDPRVGLEAGWKDAEEAAWNMRLLSSTPRPDGFRNPEAPGDRRFSNTDLAFRGDLVYVGNYHGFTVWDISDPGAPVFRTAVACPGGQGDISVHGDLVFMSAQETRARLDCGDEGVDEPVSEERFRGVRIFDLSDMENPRQVAAVQTCRGSHTHTLVTEPGNDETIWVYNSGTSAPRPAEEMEGCNPERDADDPSTSFWSIDVIEVPLSAPEEARIIDSPRVFADPETGDIDGLWEAGDHGEGTQQTRPTDRCHDITAYPEIGLAAGACSGNGILLDIKDPAAPFRVAEVADPNFAFWHSATFNNDGTTVIFTDEWGGGTQPRCRAEDDLRWGANAIFEIRNGRMEFASYYKLPAPQSELENCVAHNGSLLPVPGRDIKVQSWYQGGVSVFDFTDPANPVEIAFFDRGPVDAEEMLSAGYWSTYWYNGLVVGSEISRGMDLLVLEPSEFLSENELAAADLVRYEEFNPQHQPRYSWPPAFVVARAYLDQVVRHGALPSGRSTEVAAELDRLEALPDGTEQRSGLQELATVLWSHARAADEGRRGDEAERIRVLAGAILDLAAAR